jgi:16S rRNA (adenine1518-N6/adenine1519-N6)-dimethyltransferase
MGAEPADSRLGAAMQVPRVQTKTEIEAALRAAGLRPKHRLGQHFLIDGNLMRRLADAADIQPHDVVLEVGAGTGGLTDLLVARAGVVVAVEIDPALFAVLAARFSAAPNLTLIRSDVLARKHVIAPAVAAVLPTIPVGTAGKLLLVANLPYDVATPLLVNLLFEPRPFARFCFTVQREVGQRMEAAPGGRDYGPLAVLLQLTCRIERLARVPASAFWPRPAVESGMYRLDRVSGPFDSPDSLARFAELVRGAFRHRRKTLRYNLAQCCGQDAAERVADVVDPSCRPEAISPQQWVELAARLNIP